MQLTQAGALIGRRLSRAVAVAVGLALLSAGCVLVRSVPPPDTGPAIDVRAGDHVVAVPIVPEARRGQLFVFFPGTGASPDLYTSLVSRAALLGYHAVSLDYENGKSINFQVCPNQPVECYERARLEILTGEESPYIEPDVDPTNSAFNRLTQLIAHQDAAHPDEGWGAYLENDLLRWDLIVVGGHSQGGGHAAMTAKLHKVARVLLFGSTEPRPWTLEPFATPADRFWALVHREEPSVVGITLSWENIGVPGELAEFKLTPPSGPSHRLVTTVTECGGVPGSNGYYHNCYSVDGWMPPAAADGTPVFAAAWDRMLRA